MEQTTLQKRIEQRADKKLREDLLKAANMQKQIQYIVGEENYAGILYVRDRSYAAYPSDKLPGIENTKTQDIYDKLLPRYIREVTDEILRKIDEIDFLLDNNQQPND